MNQQTVVYETLPNMKISVIALLLFTVEAGVALALEESPAENQYKCPEKLWATNDTNQLIVPAEGTTTTANFTCTYHLKARDGEVLQIDFEHLKIGVPKKCDPNYGFLTIGATEAEAKNSTDYMCSKPTTALKVNNASDVFVYFNGQTLQKDDGFTLNYTSVPLNQSVKPAFACRSGPMDSTKDTQQLTVPMPATVLKTEFQCTYHIRAKSGEVLDVQFESIRIGTSSICNPDYGFVTIGKTAEEASMSEEKMCTTPDNPLQMNNLSELFVHIEGKQLTEDDGFTLTYSSVAPDLQCDTTVQEATSKMQSLKFPLNRTCLNQKFNCIYEIKAQDGQNLYLHFDYFKIGNSSSCDTEYVKIGTTKDEIESSTEKLCGTVKPELILDHLSEFYMQIVGQNFAESDGFILHYKSVSGSDYLSPTMSIRLLFSSAILYLLT